jgi:hypothetical protein
MNEKISFAWKIFMTPFYYAFLAATSAVVLITLGPKDFRDFWRKNK